MAQLIQVNYLLSMINDNNRALILLTRALLFVLCIFHSKNVASQVTFNRGSALSLNHVYADGIHQSRNGYVFVTSIIIDTQYLNWGHGIGSIDTSGNILCFQTFVDTNRVKLLAFSPILELNDSTFLKVGIAWNPARIFLVGFNDLCDTLFTKEYETMFGDSVSRQAVIGFKRCRSGGYIITNGLAAYNHPHLAIELGLFRLDEDFNLVWSRLFGGDYRNQQGIDIIEKSNGNFIAFGLDYYDYDPAFDSIVRPLYFVEVDANGDLIRAVKHKSEIRGGNYEVVVSPDGGYILCATKFKDVYFTSGQPGNFVAENSIFKLDENFDYVWETNVGTLEKNTSLTGYQSLIPALDLSGVIAAGITVEVIDNKLQLYGIITKVGWDGDSIWSHRYILDNSLYPISTSGNFIWSIRPVSDGGYIAIGEIVYKPGSPIDPYRQQVWFLKIDENGCVVPGCQAPSSAMEIVDNYIDLRVYPNPFETTLNIFVQMPDNFGDWRIQVYNLSGVKMYEHQSRLNELSFVINTTEWPIGGYVISVVENGISRSITKAIKLQ